MDIQATYNQTYQRTPQEKELFLHDGSLYVYRGRFPHGQWENLGPDSEEDVPELGMLDFEMQDGIVARGTPSFVLRLLFRAFYGIDSDGSADLAATVFNVFRECGWRGPAESNDQKLPGTAEVDGSVYNVDDLRVVFAQLQSPEFNGWLSFEEERTPEAPCRTAFLNIGKTTRIVLTQEAS